MTIQIRDTNVYVLALAPQQTKLRDVNVYAVVQPGPQVDVRKVAGYALLEVAPQVQLRRFGGYALVAPTQRKYFNVSGSDALIAAINKEHGTNIVTGNVTFGNPVAETGFYDSSTVVKPASTWLYSGEFKLFYSRFNLADAFGADTVPKPDGAFTSVHKWLPAINALYLTALEPRDIVDAPVAANALGFKLTVAATSYIFKPGSNIFVGTVPTLATEIAISDLNGFQPAS